VTKIQQPKGLGAWSVKFATIASQGCLSGKLCWQIPMQCVDLAELNR